MSLHTWESVNRQDDHSLIRTLTNMFVFVIYLIRYNIYILVSTQG